MAPVAALWRACALATLLIAAAADFAFNFSALATLPTALQAAGNATLQTCTALGAAPAEFVHSNLSTSVGILATFARPSAADQSPCLAPSLRVAPSRPHQAGAVWARTPQAVETGFSAVFSFAVTNRSEDCERLTEINDARTTLHELCARANSEAGVEWTRSRRGGHGLAFVLQVSQARSAALGAAGSGLGWGGLEHALAIAFDSGYGASGGEALGDSVELRLAGGGGEEEAAASLAPPTLAVFSDGQTHTAKVAYFPLLRADLLTMGRFRASPRVASLQSASSGTLCVFLDDLALPLVCVPLDLARALPLRGGQAVVGFTASTGRAWQNHDVLTWSFCEGPTCS